MTVFIKRIVKTSLRTIISEESLTGVGQSPLALPMRRIKGPDLPRTHVLHHQNHGTQAWAFPAAVDMMGGQTLWLTTPMSTETYFTEKETKQCPVPALGKGPE